MWIHDDFEPSAAERELAAEFSSSSHSSPCSVSAHSRVVPSPPCATGPASEASGGRQVQPMALATAERLYRALGAGRAARPGDVLLRRDVVSPATLRRWRRYGWVAERERPFITRRGWASLPPRAQVVAFAVRAGRSTLFL